MEKVSYAGRMTRDADDALSWEGDDDPSERRSASSAEGRAAATPRRAPRTSISAAASTEAPGRTAAGIEDDADSVPAPLSTTMLLVTGVVGGIYLLYSVGWVVGGLRLQPLARFFVADFMFLPWFVLAIAAPALWFLAVWVLTRAKATWIRIALLLLGVVLLVPWPFVTVGVIG